MEERIIYWLDLSDYDLETAQAMLQTKRYLYVGFMCHQAVEKAFKAMLSSKDCQQLPPKIHNLIRLAEQSKLFDEMSEKHKKTLFMLNPLNIESRYPTYKENLLKQLDEDKCSEILNNTKELILWIKEQL